MDLLDNNLSLSLCSGAGGLDLGLEEAGWDTAAQIEMDADCVATLSARAAKKSFAPEAIHARLEEVDPASLRRRLGLRKGQLGLLAGGPPCQPFTTHGLRQVSFRGAENDRAGCVRGKLSSDYGSGVPITPSASSWPISSALKLSIWPRIS